MPPGALFSFGTRMEKRPSRHLTEQIETFFNQLNCWVFWFCIFFHSHITHARPIISCPFTASLLTRTFLTFHLATPTSTPWVVAVFPTWGLHRIQVACRCGIICPVIITKKIRVKGIVIILIVCRCRTVMAQTTVLLMNKACPAPVPLP